MGKTVGEKGESIKNLPLSESVTLEISPGPIKSAFKDNPFLWNKGGVHMETIEHAPDMLCIQATFRLNFLSFVPFHSMAQ